MYKALAYLGGGLFTVLCLILTPFVMAASLLLPYFLGTVALLFAVIVFCYDCILDRKDKNEDK